ncbi:nitric oxide reductase F protein [Roseovarius faecimaris]|uniref:Nitric oxide reductase F protein n=1 Tax=Roseovarius faecimaris TaxID=2494550 RepID=A0A6I6J0I9_9RHOB|nr:cytochrome C oxidase subunit IV family protein [Roseovarius faecimaris]QGX98358.1 nitric oxide reductase F protein [Roseovarius faecimaris]
MSALERAWIGLALLSAASTLIALSPLPAPYTGALILACAWGKARLIFLWYLELAPVPSWRSGILTGLSLFMLLLMGLYVAA